MRSDIWGFLNTSKSNERQCDKREPHKTLGETLGATSVRGCDLWILPNFLDFSSLGAELKPAKPISSFRMLGLTVRA